jgi:hypothetical protein
MKNKKLANLLAFKANLFEVFVIAVLVSLGVNILASGFLEYLNFSSSQSLIIGGLFVTIGLLILLRNLQPENSGSYEFEGVICTDRDSGKLIPIQNYEITEELEQAINALCSENKAFQKIWSESPIGLGMSFENGRAISKRPKSNAILLEAIEYWWTRAVLITSAANNLHKAHVQYLESKLVSEAFKLQISNLKMEQIPHYQVCLKRHKQIWKHLLINS